MIFTKTTPSFEPQLSADKGGDFGAFSLPGKAKELQVSSSVDSPMSNASYLANPPGSVPFVQVGESYRPYGNLPAAVILKADKDEIIRRHNSLAEGAPDWLIADGYVEPMPRPQWFEHLAPSVATDYWYICAAQNIRELARQMSPILDQDLQLTGLLQRWSGEYDGFRHYGYSVTCQRKFRDTPSEGRDALLELEAYEKLHFDPRGSIPQALMAYSITKNRDEYDKVCAALDFKVGFGEDGNLSEDFRDKSEKFRETFLLPQEEFLAGFKVRLDRAVASLTTCPMMRRGDSKKALPEIIECVRELYRRASSND
jgi:hypothetical protein